MNTKNIFTSTSTSMSMSTGTPTPTPIPTPARDWSAVRGAAAIRGVQAGRAARIACAEKRQRAQTVHIPPHGGTHPV